MKATIQKARELYTSIGISLEEEPATTIDATLAADFILDHEQQTITAKDSQQLFYGLTTYYLNQVTNKQKQTSYTAQINERCLMIDIGRKYFSLSELKALVHSMAFFQFTHLQLHFSENEGFRIASDRFPEIVSKEHLTKAEVRELIAYANDYGIELIPDFDSPGHLKQVLANHPQWCLPNAAGGVDARALNILDDEAVAFVREIYKEYAELFADSHYFHIGADEFVDFDRLEDFPTLVEAAKEAYGPEASGIEVFIAYVNDLVDYITDLGFVVRVWNDGFYRLNRNEQLSLTKNCEISYWTRWNQNMAPVTHYFDQGYSVINHNDNFFYYVVGEAAGYTYPTYEKISNEFTLTTFANGQQVSQEQLTQTPAIALAIWADIPDAKAGATVIEEVFWLQAAICLKVYEETDPGKETFSQLFQKWLSLLTNEQ
ncbi:family 20 glycosylhydrolase [Enterococcus sp.]|uniref:family 20 glycosylhydrolase n=1 Tax=Enterococcus sp. TaxID=35783 RepID=UPI0025BB4D71|nr:family 20 glycosylhydrolase [Enterococcus sp.]